MRIGLAFDLKTDDPPPPGAGDDWQEEFDSPETVAAIADAIRGMGHEPVELGNGPALLRRLLDDPPDLVFNFAEGHGTARSREARVPAVCEMLGVRCTGSDPLALAVALDKAMTRTVVAAAGVTVPRGWVYDPRRDDLGHFADWWDTHFPLIVKPAWEGSSKGVRNRSLVHSSDELLAALTDLSAYGQPLLIEEFVAGPEVTVGLVGNPPRVLGVMAIEPVEPTEHFVYSLEVKRDFRRQVRYRCPAGLDWAAAARAEAAALSAWDALGCRDVARLDFRVRDGQPYFIEANPLPGLNPSSSDLVLMANLVGVSHAELVRRIIGSAVARTA